MKRRTGNTTRIIDRCIQELFKNGITYVFDGRGSDTMVEQTNDVFKKFIDRLKNEHPNAKYHYKVDQSTFYCYKVETHNL